MADQQNNQPQLNQPQEYWINVYEYKTIKNTQFYSHCIESKSQAKYYAKGRTNGKCVYRIHVKMKPVKPKYEWRSEPQWPELFKTKFIELD